MASRWVTDPEDLLGRVFLFLASSSPSPNDRPKGRGKATAPWADTTDSEPSGIGGPPSQQESTPPAREHDSRETVGEIRHFLRTSAGCQDIVEAMQRLRPG